MQKPKIFFLVGPTAIGKTETAVWLAKKLNAEIISCDSMQIYKGMDIITSKPPLVLRRKIPHHLIDKLCLSQEYDVSRYRKDALKKIQEILKKGRSALFVGGTGLYISILIEGIFSQSSQNKAIRLRLYKEAGIKGSKFLYKRLKGIDPEAALKIHPNDTRRIIRALEVFEITGKPISQLQKQRSGLSKDYDTRVFCLNMERNKLYNRIDERVDKMFRRGVVKEVKKLLKLRLSKTASCAIGMKELKGYFSGEYDLEMAKELMKQNTRNYAKRQLTWFRKEKRINWINISGDEKPKEIADRIWKGLS